MVPPNQGSILFQDSSLNMTPRENRNILGYKDPNKILQDVPDREWTLISVVKFSDPDDETGSCGNPYKFAMLMSPEIINLDKTIIIPNW